MKSPCFDCPVHALHLQGIGSKEDCAEKCPKRLAFMSAERWGMTCADYDTLDTDLQVSRNCQVGL